MPKAGMAAMQSIATTTMTLRIGRSAQRRLTVFTLSGRMVFETRCAITKPGVTAMPTSFTFASFTPQPGSATWCFLPLEHLDEFAKLACYLVADGKHALDRLSVGPTVSASTGGYDA
jgi:hypothetical protein